VVTLFFARPLVTDKRRWIVIRYQLIVGRVCGHVEPRRGKEIAKGSYILCVTFASLRLRGKTHSPHTPTING